MKSSSKVLCSLAALVLVLLIVLTVQRTNQNEVVYRAVQSAPATYGLTYAGPTPVTKISTNSGSFPVIPGGITSVKDFCSRAETDPVLAAYIKGFNCAIGYQTTLGSDIRVFMTFRKGDVIAWAGHPILVRKGEQMITDGIRSFLTRCANEIKFTPQTPTMNVQTADLIPPVSEPEPPVRYSGTTTVYSSPAPSPAPHAAVSESKSWWAVAAAPIILFHNDRHEAPPKPACDSIEYGDCGRR